jgi:hypothetical protein
MTINHKKLEEAKKFPPMTKGMLLSKIDEYLSFFDQYIKHGFTKTIIQDSMKLKVPAGISNDEILREYEHTVARFLPNYYRNKEFRGYFDPDQLPSKDDALHLIKELKTIRTEIAKTMPMEKEEIQ